MIRNNLSILLAERSLKAIDVSNDTKIARSTLSKISNNSTEKIDYSTINTLCTYLSIEPKDFFTFIPLDILIDLEIESLELKKHKMEDGLVIPELKSFILNGYFNVKDHTDGYNKYEYEIKFESTSIDRDTKFFDEISLPKIQVDAPFSKLNNHKTGVSDAKHFLDNVWNKLDMPFKVSFVKELKSSILTVISDEISTIYLNDYMNDSTNKKAIAKNLKKRYLSSKLIINNRFFNL